MARLNRSALVALCAALLVSGCIMPTSYVDSALPTVGTADVVAAARPEPIQAMFEFRTKGVANAKATEIASVTVMETLRASGLFSEVSSAPVASQRRLLITIDNVPIMNESDAMAKGFFTGLTFGLVGTMVTDGYVCEATYLSPQGEPLKLRFTHAMHTTIGNASGPPGQTGRTPLEAAKVMVSQLTWSVLRDLSKSGRLQP